MYKLEAGIAKHCLGSKIVDTCRGYAGVMPGLCKHQGFSLEMSILNSL